jgi:non-ribosomal peptide synthetase-like protein
MGARIGRNVQLGSHHLYAFDLLTIGDNSSVGAEAQIPGYYVAHGQVTLGPVTIGQRCYVGTKSVLHTDVTLEDEACLGELSMAPVGTHIPAGAQWSGSPAQPIADPVADFATEDAPAPSRLHQGLNGLFYFLSVLFLLPLFPLAAGLPAGLLLIVLATRYGYGSLLAIPLLAASYVVLLALEIALGKWILLGHVTPGRYSVYSGFYLRKWFVDSLMQMGLELLHPLYATLYLPPWFRLLGAKLGKRVEISTVAFITPELLTIDNESFIADSACLGAPKIHRGWLSLGATAIGKRTFVGNSALVPNATQIGDESLIGCLSTPPSKDTLTQHPHSAWLGSPSVRLPHRQESESFPDEMIFHPPWSVFLLRGVIEFFRVTLPTMFTLVILVLFFAVVLSIGGAPFWQRALLLPVVSLGLATAMVLVVIALKWLVIGRYQPCVRPLWSSYVWRNELITALHESFCAPVLLNMFQGTPFMSTYFRWMGARIGKRVLWESTQLTEFDQVQVGDDVALNLNSTLQTHLFEDRVMKTSRLIVGDQATIGPMSVVLYDSEMREGASLSGLSLLMKGETLPAWTNWEGIPARRGQDH